MIVLNFDGACRVNPGGPGRFGFVIRRGKDLIHHNHGPLGEGPWMTNNLAEYIALEMGLRWLLDAGFKNESLLILGDSKLVVEQVAGRWRSKKQHLTIRLDFCQSILRWFRDWRIEWIPRRENWEADELSKSG